jgi:hypothetical protein
LKAVSATKVLAAREIDADGHCLAIGRRWEGDDMRDPTISLSAEGEEAACSALGHS